jgi:hypothetical protein
VATFCESSIALDIVTVPKKKGTLDYILGMPADRSKGPHPVSLPPTTIEVVEKAKHSLIKKLH